MRSLYPIILLCLCTSIACSSSVTPVKKAPLSPMEQYKAIFKQPVSGFVVLRKSSLKYTNLLDARMRATKRPSIVKKPTYARLHLGRYNFVLHKVIKDHGDVVEIQHLVSREHTPHCTKGIYSRHNHFYVSGFIPKRDLVTVLKNPVTQNFKDGTFYTFQPGTPITRAKSPKRVWDFVASTQAIQLPLEADISDLALSYATPQPLNLIKPKYNKRTRKYEPERTRLYKPEHLSLDGYPIWAKKKYDYIPSPLNVVQSHDKDLVTLRTECLEVRAIHNKPKAKAGLMLGVLGGIGTRGWAGCSVEQGMGTSP